MSKETKIEWADSTLNFWSGCTKVSDGCKNCYAEALSNRKLGNIGGWGKGAERKRHQSAFNLAFQLNKKPWICPNGNMPMKGAPGGHGPYSGDVIKSPQPCAECGAMLRRRRVFSLSLGDWLDPEVPIEWLAEMLDTIRRCDQLEWLLVTKRPELFKDRLTAVMKWHENSPRAEGFADLWRWLLKWASCEKAPSHVMVLTSVENQKAADERIPALLRIPAARRGLSCEPLLGPVNLNLAKGVNRNIEIENVCGPWIHWVIIGGESGADARACDVEWIRVLALQCKFTGVPCFVKQLGAFPQLGREDTQIIRDKKGGDMAEWPGDLRVREFPASALDLRP